MKLLVCDGRNLTVYDLGPIVMRVVARDYPIKLHGHRVLSDNDARATVKAILATGFYEKKEIE